MRYLRGKKKTFSCHHLVSQETSQGTSKLLTPSVKQSTIERNSVAKQVLYVRIQPVTWRGDLFSVYRRDAYYLGSLFFFFKLH